MTKTFSPMRRTDVHTLYLGHTRPDRPHTRTASNANVLNSEQQSPLRRHKYLNIVHIVFHCRGSIKGDMKCLVAHVTKSLEILREKLMHHGEILWHCLRDCGHSLPFSSGTARTHAR